jgi:pyruvate/2-oxoglutarate dehydrogenase complex dihydrolipoamide acyltransferase (E2) component
MENVHKMNMKESNYTAIPFPWERQMIIEGGRIASKRHSVFGLIEVDVTDARRILRDYRERTGESLSFTAFIAVCLGKAVDENKMVHAYRDWRNRLILFDEVDVNMVVEIEMEGRKVTLPHFVRAANKRTVDSIHHGIRKVQKKPRKSREFGTLWFARLPAFVRDIFYFFVFRNPHWLKRTFCTVGITAVGMFGKGSGWVVPFNVHTLDVALGGIAEKPVAVNGQIAIREMLCVTLVFDHDLVDGAPATRFASHFKELIESSYGLDELPIPNTVQVGTAIL